MAGEILYCFNIYTSKEQVGNIGMTEDVRSDLKINGINAVAIDNIEKLGNCSSRVSYDYTQEEVQKIIDELDYQLKHLKESFSGKRAFSLSSSEEPDEQ